MLSHIKSKIKKVRDSFYSKNTPTKEEVGKLGDSWFIDLKNINQNSIIVSGGIGKDISFEKELIDRFNVNIHLFDPSPTGINTIKNTSSNYTNKIHFQACGLYGENGFFTFNNPEKIEEGSYRLAFTNLEKEENLFACKNLETILKEINKDKVDLLKIDIEGSEYSFLNEIISKKIQVNQICVEFHHFFNDIKKKETTQIIQKLQKTGYQIIHKKELDYTFEKII